MAEMKYHSVAPIREESISQVTATPSVALGTRVFVKGEEYVYCYNAGGATIAQGLGVKFITGASGYSIAATSIAESFNPFVGVTKHVAMASGDYGWVMTKGFTSVTVVSARSAGADYLMLALGTAGKFIEASGTTTMGTATVVAYGLGTPAPDAGGLVYAFIKSNA